MPMTTNRRRGCRRGIATSARLLLALLLLVLLSVFLQQHVVVAAADEGDNNGSNTAVDESSDDAADDSEYDIKNCSLESLFLRTKDRSWGTISAAAEQEEVESASNSSGANDNDNQHRWDPWREYGQELSRRYDDEKNNAGLDDNNETKKNDDDAQEEEETTSRLDVVAAFEAGILAVERRVVEKRLHNVDIERDRAREFVCWFLSCFFFKSMYSFFFVLATDLWMDIPYKHFSFLCSFNHHARFVGNAIRDEQSVGIVLRIREGLAGTVRRGVS